MKNLTNKQKISISVSNYKDFSKQTGDTLNLQAVKYLTCNQLTTSSNLNELLITLVSNFSNPVKKIPSASPSSLVTSTQLSLLKFTCSSDANLLSYKGINLGSAINMKLAVKLGSLLGKQQG